MNQYAETVSKTKKQKKKIRKQMCSSTLVVTVSLICTY